MVQDRTDLREYIRDHYAYIANEAQDIGGVRWKARSRTQTLLRRLTNLISIPIKTNMLIVARKD